MNQLPPILLLNTGGISLAGGGNFHTIDLYQKLSEAKLKTAFLVVADSKTEQETKSRGLSCQSVVQSRVLSNRLIFKTILIWKIIKLAKQLGPACIVQCNHRNEVWAAKIARFFVPIKIVLARHIPNKISHRRISGITGALGSGAQTTAMLQAQNKRAKKPMKIIADLPMFFNQSKFLDYQPTENRATFFHKYFNTTIPDQAPLLCMIANLYKDLNHKNHPLLLHALAKLNTNRQNKVHVVLAGDGPSAPILKELVKKLNLTNEIHFLGFSNKTPGILYHSDIFVLTSKEEAFGIAYLEAGLMKKPLVGATNTGAEHVVLIHEKTGLLFKNNDVDDLVLQLERLIDDKNLRLQLGQNAYEHVKKNHSNEVGLEKMLNFYAKLALL